MPDEQATARVALVTGAAGGMGRAIAARLAAAGARIALNDLAGPALDAAVAALRRAGHDAVPVAGDVTSADDVAGLVDAVVAALGPVDVLVNNAGVLRPTRFVDIPEAEWDFVVGVNLKGTYLVTRAVLPAMQRRKWGRVINLSSTAGKNVSTIGGAHYTAAKAGILGLTRHVAREVGGDGVTVNAVCPGLIATEMVHATISAERTRRYEQSFPIARLGEPGEVAELVAFLASDAAAYITGASLDINGGDLMI